jgi:ABC-type sugar transport system permease subunit/outer membrane protein assembly factor BamB
MQKKIFLFGAGIFALFFALDLVFCIRVSSQMDILELTSYKTGKQNSCLAYDEAKGIFIVGTYNNQLIAFSQSGTRLWSFDARGPFRQLYVHSDFRRLYAANEDNHVYILDLDTGSLNASINVERRIYNIDVKSDGSEIMVSAGISTAKHNILRYTAEGEQIQNLQFGIRIQGAAYAPDYQDIIFINNRAEVVRIDPAGNQTGFYQLQHELADLRKTAGNNYIVLSKTGSYYVFDGELKLLREGNPVESFSITGRAVGSSASGDYIVVGTEERFLYFFNKADKQIFTGRLENSITNVMALENELYITGLGDFIYRLPVDALDRAGNLIGMALPLRILLIVLALGSLICIILGIEKTRSFVFHTGVLLYRHRVPYLLLIPTFVLLVLFNYSSVFLAMTRAFTNWSKDNTTWATMKFVGLDNFRLMLEEGYFLTGVYNLFLFLITGFAKVLTVPLLVAWLVYSMKNNRQKTVFRFLFVLPMVVPGVVGALMWKQIYDPSIGLINQLLGKIGLETWQQVWLGDEKWAIWAIIFMGFPFVSPLAFLVYYGGLMDIDLGILESARIDGANRIRIFFRIQLPILMSHIKMILILVFIGTVQDFSGVFLLTSGGPGTSTYVPGLELYFNTTKFGRFGYACALGLVLFIFTLIGTLLNMRLKTHSE